MAQVFVNNLDRVLSQSGVNGAYARKVFQVTPRFVWYPYRSVVLPSQPDADFVRYAASLGFAPRILVPRGINPRQMTILSGFDDPRLVKLLRGATVESYIRDTELYRRVTALGGTYVGGDPGNTTQTANDKGRYSSFAQGVVHMPPNQRLVNGGTTKIAQAVAGRLRQGRHVFVRLTLAGGGLGNRQFEPSAHGNLSLKQICHILEGDQPQAWRHGTALVEDKAPLRWSPGIAFHTETGGAYDFLQVTSGGDYIGCWSPLPPNVYNPADIARVGDHFAAQLRKAHFHGWADTDLGVGLDGRLYGFEINGRMDGVRHNVEIGQGLFGPWSSWRQRGITTKALDHLVLARPMSFASMYNALHESRLLATRNRPYGTVITIPPAGNIAGVQVFGRGYRDTEQRFQAVLQAVGSPDANREDHPLFP